MIRYHLCCIYFAKKKYFFAKQVFVKTFTEIRKLNFAYAKL
jgi:hypothetical protein